MVTVEGRRRKVGDAARTRNLSPPLWSWWCCARAPKGCHLAVVLLSWAVSTLLFCMPCLVRGQFISRQNNVQDHLDFHACGDHIKARANPALDSFVSDRNEKQGEYNDIQQTCSKDKHICSDSQSLCFPCTLAGFKAENDKNERYSNEDATINNVKKQELRQDMQSDENMVQEQVKLTKNVTFRLIDGRTTVSCFPSPSYHLNKNISLKMEKLEQIQPEPYETSSSPNVAISPSLMEWGPQPLFSPSVSFLTVLNTCNDTDLHVFKPFSTNSQFYAYGFEEMIVAPHKMVSIAFVFLPRMLGISTGHLVLQTSLGGFLVQVQGEGVESPYRVQPFTGVNAFSGTRLRDNMTLYNPFDGLLFVEEISAWIAKSEDSSTQPTGAVCKTNFAFGAGNQNLLSNEDPQFGFGIDVTGIQLLGIRPLGGWEINPHCSSTVMELDISTHLEGKFSGDLCIILKNALQDTTQTVIVPLEADIMKNPGIDLPIHPVLNFIKSDIVSKGEQTIKVALSLDNDGSELVRLEEICERSGDAKLLEIEFFQGLLLLPGTVTHVAMITYKVIEKTSPYDYQVQQSSLLLDCRLLVVTNSTQGPQLEVPCQDLIYDHDSLEENDVLIEVISESVHGISTKVKSQRKPINLQTRFQGSYTVSQSVLKDKALKLVSEADELFLNDWKSQGASENLSVLVQSEIMYPMIQIGTEGSKWFSVSNPSEQPVVMQLILSSEAVAAQCKEDGEVWESWEPNHSYLTANRLTTKITDDRDSHYTDVFFLPEYGVTEAKVHPHGKASFGPIFFHPPKRCVWTSSVFIKNNLSGVEWLPLQGAGGSVHLSFLEGSEPIQALHFNVQKPYEPPSTIGAVKFYSNQFFYRAGMKACNKPLLKAILAKNMGDMPLEVNTIEVAGKTCGSDGFRVHTCNRFFLVPGESIELLVSYQSDFSAAVVYRDLQLTMSSGILVIPMEASLPDYMVMLCQKSSIWFVLRKTILVIFLVALLFALVFRRLLAQDTALVDSNQWHRQKFAITEMVKGVAQGDHLKQSSAAVSNAKLNFPVVKNKIPKEQHMSSVVRKVGEPIWEGNGTSNFHDGLERNNSISQSEYEHTKCLHDAETKALIKSDVGKDQFRDDSRFSQNSDARNFYLPSAMPESLDFSAESNASNRKCGINHSQCKQTKSIHDNSNKTLLNSGLGADKSLDVTGSSESSDARVSFSQIKVPEPLNSVGESNPPAVSSDRSLSHMIPHSGNSLTVKLEKEKGKRRKKRSGAMTMKQDVPSSQSGNSTPSSPASPITPVASSRPVSPLVNMASQSNLMLTSSVGVEDFKHIESTGCQYMSKDFPKTQGKGGDASQAGFGADVCKIHSCEVGVGVMQAKEWDNAASFSKAIFKQKNAEELTAANGDWVTVAKKSASSLNNSKGIRLLKSELNSSTKMTRPQLTTSATFPRGRCQASNLGWNHPIVIGMKQTTVPSPPNPSLVSTSAIAPHARAPGTKLTKSNSVHDGQGVSLKSKLIEQDSTYDIWGNHFANFPLPSSANASAITELPNVLSSTQGYSQSFFARFAPQAHLEKTTVPSSSSNQSDSVSVLPSD